MITQGLLDRIATIANATLKLFVDIPGMFYECMAFHVGFIVEYSATLGAMVGF